MTKSTAEKLMSLAADADMQAQDYLNRLVGDEVTLADMELYERAAFYQGQASGFRQSAYFAAILEGTNAND